MTTTKWVRVSRSNPCPVCERPDWCLVSEDKTACICPRVESARRAGEAGYLHRLTDAPTGHRDELYVVRILARPTPPDLTVFADRCHTSLPPARLAGLADSLGLSAESLTAIRVGWSADHLAWSFPMTDPATGKVVGIRLRNPDGSKYAVKGGKEGLFIPITDPIPNAPLLVTEGPTDTAALLDLGFLNVAGRPSCTGGIKHLVALVRSRRPKDVGIVADADEPGRRGAANLASVLRVYAPAVRVIEPPVGMKDLRAWKLAGATRAEVEQLIQAAPGRRLGIRIARRTRS